MSSVLFVCTGNICRSPMAEGFLRGLLEDRGIGEVEVRSAGTHARDGYGAVAEAVAAAAESGIDITGHVSRELDAQEVTAADLVLCMTQDQVAIVKNLVPQAADRTFSLKEFVRLLGAAPVPLPPPPGDPGPGPQEVLRSAVATAARLRASGQVRVPADTDVADPLGLGAHAFRATAWEIGELCSGVADGIFGSLDPPEREAAPHAPVDAPAGPA